LYPKGSAILSRLIRLWKISARIAGGMIPRNAAAAISLAYEIWKNIADNAGGNVGAGEPAFKRSEKVNSFQEVRKAITAQAATPGIAMGTMTRQKACQRVRPSTRAARSTLRGSEAKKPLMIQAIRGMVIVR